jgi:prefoldin subunit 5
MAFGSKTIKVEFDAEEFVAELDIRIKTLTELEEKLREAAKRSEAAATKMTQAVDKAKKLGITIKATGARP